MSVQKLEKEIKRYLKPTKRGIQLSHKHRKELYNQVLSSARQIIREKPEITTEQLHKALGTPMDLAKDYRDEMGAEKLQKAYRRSKWITISLSVFGALVAVVAAYFIIVYVLPTDVTEYYYSEGQLYTLDENGNNVLVESVPEGAPEYIYSEEGIEIK